MPICAFLVHAKNSSVGPMLGVLTFDIEGPALALDKQNAMMDTSSVETWEQSIRWATGVPDAEILLVPEVDWKAPSIDSVDVDAETFVAGIQDFFVSRLLSPISSKDLLGTMRNAWTGLVVILVHHSKELLSGQTNG